MPNKILLAGAAAVAALACSAPAASAYTPGMPGDVGVAASYVLSHDYFDETPGDSPGDVHASDQDSQKGTSVASVGSANFPPLPPAGWPWVACTGGCGDSQATGAARADATGTLEVYGRTMAGVTQTAGGASASVTGRAQLDDTITVSKDTTVILKGRVLAALRRANSDFDNESNPIGGLDVSLVFGYCYEGCPGSSFVQDYEAEPTSTQASAVEQVDDTFEVAIPLEAGTTPFNADVRAIADATVHGEAAHPDKSQVSSTDGELGDNRVEFQIVVPDDVAVSSGSGKLPIVGGQPQQPTDTTPPTLTVPSAVTTDALTPSGARVSYDVAATDESGTPTVTCSPASGSAFAIGSTTVTCVATDAAGNETTESFIVKVRSAAEQFEALRAKVALLPKKAAKELEPHVKKMDCNALKQVSKKAADLAKHGDLTTAQAAELDLLADRIAAVLACK